MISRAGQHSPHLSQMHSLLFFFQENTAKVLPPRCLSAAVCFYSGPPIPPSLIFFGGLLRRPEITPASSGRAKKLCFERRKPAGGGVGVVGHRGQHAPSTTVSLMPRFLVLFLRLRSRSSRSLGRTKGRTASMTRGRTGSRWLSSQECARAGLSR